MLGTIPTWQEALLSSLVGGGCTSIDPRLETSCQCHPEIPSDIAFLLLRARGFTLGGQGIRQSLRLDSLAHDGSP